MGTGISSARKTASEGPRLRRRLRREDGKAAGGASGGRASEGKPAACNNGLLSMNCGLLWGIVTYKPLIMGYYPCILGCFGVEWPMMLSKLAFQASTETSLNMILTSYMYHLGDSEEKVCCEMV